MQAKSGKKLYHITLVYPKELIRTVKVRASSREAAERYALKRNPSAIGVKPNA